MLSEDQLKDIELYKKIILYEIQQVVTNSDKIKDRLLHENIMAIIYLKIFYAYLQERKFENIEEAWRFMNDARGVIDKILYVNHDLLRKEPSFKNPANV